MRKLLLLSCLLIIPPGCRLFPLFRPRPPSDTGIADLVRFKSAEEFRQYVADQVSYQAQNSRGGGGLFEIFLPIAPAAPPASLDADAGGTGGATESGEYSETNVQEAGVGEADFVKNDGQYIYVLRRGGVRIVSATPPDAMQQVAAVALEGHAGGLYLAGDRLVAITRLEPYYYYDGGGPGWPGGPIAFAQEVDIAPPPGDDKPPSVLVTILDVSTPSDPAVVTEVTVEGTLNTSRLIDGRLHVILNLYSYLPQPLTAEAVLGTPVDDLLPDFSQSSGGAVVQQGNFVAPTDIYHPVDSDGYGMTAVVSLDVTSDDPDIQSTAVLADAETVYASATGLYLTDARYNFSGDLRETTDLFKFDLTGEQVEYVAAGTVKGRLLNQYSLGAYEGHLRVATTSTEGGGGGPFVGTAQTIAPPTSLNNVYVLAQQDSDLNVVGKIEGLAPGEQIYAARFVGPYGFLVTFVKLDPLFKLDLSDPTNPQVVGELKIDGVSDYIHILDGNHLLTVGRAAIPENDFAWFQGVQLTVFDVTGSDPVALHRIEIGDRGTSTEVQYNPKAATFLPSQNLMALPINLYEGKGSVPWSYGEFTFGGLYVYRVTVENGFELLGRISMFDTDRGWYDETDTRGVFIGENVYAVTPDSLKAAPLSDVDSAPWSLPLLP